MMKNMRAKADLEGGPEKADKPSPAANIRRLSVAAINFFAGDKKKKEDKKRKNGSLSDINQHPRGSVVEDDDCLPFSPEFLAGGRRPSLLDVLGPLPQSGTNTPLSPMLEQTSLADFIRIMSTLRSMEQEAAPLDGTTGPATAPPVCARRRTSLSPSLSQLFSGPPTRDQGPPLPREVLRAREVSSTGNLARARRYSQAPVPQHVQAFRRRAASISQGHHLSYDKPSLLIQHKPKRLIRKCIPKRTSLPTVMEEIAV